MVGMHREGQRMTFIDTIVIANAAQPTLRLCTLITIGFLV